MQVTKALDCKWKEEAIYHCGTLLISGKFVWCLRVRKLELTLAPSAVKIMMTTVFLSKGFSFTGNSYLVFHRKTN